jgi:hypothetical protein
MKSKSLSGISVLYLKISSLLKMPSFFKIPEDIILLLTLNSRHLSILKIYIKMTTKSSEKMTHNLIKVLNNVKELAELSSSTSTLIN